MANQLILGRALDANGYIASGAKATIYADGTATLITVYSDVDGTTPATNPIIADGDGFWPQRYVTKDAKAVVTTSADVALYTLDPAPTSQGTGAAASAVSFTPTIELPQTNVQDAIEAAGALAVSGFAAFGLGITGNATLLANLDATGIGAGGYRFDGTTTGTYPTGVAAADTGIYDLYRQSGSVAKAYLYPSNSNRVFERRMSASVWGAWRETPNVNQATAQGDIAIRGASDWERLPKGTAGQALVMNGGATAPEWSSASPVKAWANFHGAPVAGTYSRTGTLVTVTQTSHGLSSGMVVVLDFTTGTATDGTYTITVVDANTYTVTDVASGSTSGNLTRNIAIRASSNISTIARLGTGLYRATVSSAFADAFYAVAGSVVGTGSGGFGNLCYICSNAEVPTTTTFAFRTSRDDGTPFDCDFVHIMAIR